ncbi:Phage-like element PbsX protein XkdW [uncultured Mediterranean phage uvMED]|nr:Phage-like element PbsX protein XkdW [uncultured Mediterranean phage uvMED]BAR37064.1 Phage-like element PbsX protein XkdW [uncultured Mediterranean phage uvMED]
MINLTNKIIAYLGRTPDFDKEVKLQDDGQGAYIKEWNITSEKAKPTDEQLNALSSQATALENNAKIDAKRQTEYLSWQQQFEMIYKDQKNGTTTYKDHCDKVRSDNPKG